MSMSFQTLMIICLTGGESVVVSITVDGQTVQGSPASSIEFTGGTSMVSRHCRPEKTGECFDCCQGLKVLFFKALPWIFIPLKNICLLQTGIFLPQMCVQMHQKISKLEIQKHYPFDFSGHCLAAQEVSETLEITGKFFLRSIRLDRDKKM